jgi:hypothetical protein
MMENTIDKGSNEALDAWFDPVLLIVRNSLRLEYFGKKPRDKALVMILWYDFIQVY